MAAISQKNEVTWTLLFDTFLIIKKWGPHARMASFFGCLASEVLLNFSRDIWLIGLEM